MTILLVGCLVSVKSGFTNFGRFLKIPGRFDHMILENKLIEESHNY